MDIKALLDDCLAYLSAISDDDLLTDFEKAMNDSKDSFLLDGYD